MSLFENSRLTEDEIDELMASTVFEEHEIEALYERFCYLDRANAGFLTFAEFQMIPEFDSNPFSPLLIAHLEQCSNYEQVNFACFLDFLSVFSEKTDKSLRVAFLFDLFDLNRNGKLSRPVLGRILEILGNEAGEKEIAKVFKYYDKNKKGYLSRGDFSRLYSDDESLEKNMIIDFSRHSKDPTTMTFWDILWPSFLNKDE